MAVAVLETAGRSPRPSTPGEKTEAAAIFPPILVLQRPPPPRTSGRIYSLLHVRQIKTTHAMAFCEKQRSEREPCSTCNTVPRYQHAVALGNHPSPSRGPHGSCGPTAPVGPTPPKRRKSHALTRTGSLTESSRKTNRRKTALPGP